MNDLDRHHAAIWAAIETVAARQGMTCSGLARFAGLDATAFNRSKRMTDKGPRWPSAETIASVLAATGVTWTEFGQLVDGA